MKEKSLKINAVLNGIKTIMSMIFPLITFPYVSRVLQVNNIGKINFSQSIVNYFSLIAGLGILTYATREGARLRNDQEKLNCFSNQIFTINLISTLLAYILLILVTFITPKLQSYKILIAIESLNIIGTTIGINWLYAIYEDYLYITIRSISFQFLSLILMFILVHNQNDYIKYAWISVISNSGSNILNYIHSKKYIRLKLSKINLHEHIIPILVIFSSTIATTIYVSLDSTMLGFMCGDYYVGIYSTSVKIYTIVKSVVSSVILVSLPRLSNYLANNRINEFKKVAYDIFDTIMVILLPIVVGLFMTSKELILILAGKSYIESVLSLQILSISLFFSILGIYYTNAVLLPLKQEKVIMWATIVSAVVNITLNFWFIRILRQNGAALTTVLSEIIVFLIQYIAVKGKMPFNINFKGTLSIVSGCSLIIISCILIDKLSFIIIIKFIIKVVVSGTLYFIMLYFMKNKAFLSIIYGFKKKKYITE